MATCSKCNQTPRVLRLMKCTQCFKTVCERCAVKRYSQSFCSEDCAKAFVFSSEEDL